MKKLTILLILSLVLAMALAACGGSGSSSESQQSSSESVESTDSSVSVPASSEPESSSVADSSVSTPDSSAAAKPAQASGELSDDITSKQVQIDGVVYTFPLASVQELLDNGWSCEKPFDFDIPSNNTTSGYTMKNDAGHQFVISFLNDDAATKDVMECKVYSFSFSSWAASKGAEVILPGGFTMGALYDEVHAAYGEATTERETEGAAYTLEYGERHNKVVLDFDYETKELRDIYYTFSE